MSDGWISLHRQICDNALWEDKPFARGQAWVDLLLMVNHEPRKIVRGNRTVFVGRGSTITSIRKLAERWGWSRHKVVDFLTLLQSMQMAKIQSDTKETAITIVNYSFFQDSRTKKGQKRDSEGTRRDTNNNDNNDNNTSSSQLADGESDNKKDSAKGNKPPKLIPHDNNAYLSAEYMAKKILKHTPSFPQLRKDKREATIQRWAKDIDLMLRLDGIDLAEFKLVLQYSQTDPFWQQNILSGKKLREQYGQLLVKMQSEA